MTLVHKFRKKQKHKFICHYYAQKQQVNNEKYEYQKLKDNEHRHDNNGRQEQNDNKIEVILQFLN